MSFPRARDLQIAGNAPSLRTPATRAADTQWGGRELEDNPGRDRIQVVELSKTIVPGVTTAMRYRSQNPLDKDQGPR